MVKIKREAGWRLKGGTHGRVSRKKPPKRKRGRKSERETVVKKKAKETGDSK